VGWLMLQWLGVLVPTAFRDEVRRAAERQGKSVYQRTPNVQPGAQARFMGEAEAVEFYPDTVTGRARRLVAKMNEGRAIRVELFDVDRRVEDASTFEAGEVMTWPNVESMLSGEPPDGYDRALLRAAVEGNGVAITRVDPEAGTVTVSTEPPYQCHRCGTVLGGTYGLVCMNCELDT
jgi:hypothetical protein